MYYQHLDSKVLEYDPVNLSCDDLYSQPLGFGFLKFEAGYLVPQHAHGVVAFLV